MFYIDHLIQSNKIASLPVKIKAEKAVLAPIRKRKSKPVDLARAISHKENKGPNMSRKVSGMQLYPFPSFDKCDSLQFFPSTFTTCINAADWRGLEKLLKHRTERNCSFNLCGKEMSLDTYMYVFAVNSDMHPDLMSVVHQIKVVGNQIRAVMYVKYTENRVIRKAIEQTVSDPSLLDVCPTPRSNTPALDVYLAAKTEEESVTLRALVDSTDQIQVYGKGLLVLTVDEITRKITRFDASCEFISFEAAL